MNLKSLFRTKPVTDILRDTKENPDMEGHGGLTMERTLTLTDLTAFGIAAIIGAGIFATIGEVCFKGGPGVIMLFIFVGIACGFSAMCYASFASAIPISGSAYTYSYATFGELFAWIIGWDLIIEYAIGNITVAIGWSNYFTELLKGFNIHIPPYLSTDFLSARTAFNASLSGDTKVLESEEYLAWINAPTLGGFHLVLDIPAFMIVLLITALIYVGIKESKTASNVMVAIKLVIILLVIGVGFFYVKPENWSPFLPNGIGGVMKGVAGVFFAYIGFDAISTTAEECKNPQRDLPRSMIYALIVCTILYILIALVITGIVPYYQLESVKDPMAYIFKAINMNWLSYVVGISAIVAMTSVLLVFQLGQPRIWMSMSRDGLLGPVFSKLHPRFKTPAFSTIITGLLVGIPAMFLNMTIVTDLTSIGTLFAFVLVCGGMIILDLRQPELERKFKIPFMNSKFFLLPLLIFYGVIMYLYGGEKLTLLLPKDITTFEHAIPSYIFIITFVIMAILSFKHKISLIPVLGLLSCLYLMSEIPAPSWWRFLGWLVIGLIIYFTYSYKNSKLNRV